MTHATHATSPAADPHPATRSWSVDILIGQREGHTHAQARLHTGDRTHLTGTGVARCDPHDSDVPEIGQELAAARALLDLGQRLLSAASDDIEGVTGDTTGRSDGKAVGDRVVLDA